MSHDSLPDEPVDEKADVANIESKQGVSSLHDQSVSSGEQLQFTYVAYNEDCVICGAKNSGKSYLANTLLKTLNNITCFVWDFNHQFHDRDPYCLTT